MKNTVSFAVCLVVMMIPFWASAVEESVTVPVEKKLIGTWQGISGHWGKENPPPEARSFTFKKNHQVEFTIDKQTFSGTYKIDTSKSPFHIDLSFSYKGEKVTTQTIFDFPKKDQLRIAEPDPNWRRKEFNPGMTFKKDISSTANSVAPSSSGE